MIMFLGTEDHLTNICYHLRHYSPEISLVAIMWPSSEFFIYKIKDHTKTKSCLIAMDQAVLWQLFSFAYPIWMYIVKEAGNRRCLYRLYRLPYKRRRRKMKILLDAINIVGEKESKLIVMVEGSRIMQMGKLLRERNIHFEVIGSENGPVSLASARSRSPNSSTLRERFSHIKSSLDWSDYYPLNLIYSWMDEIEKQFPATCTVCSIGRSVEGRHIKMLKISNSDARNTGAWLDGAIHAREWISTSVVTYIADHIARNFTTLPVSVTNKDWYFVPVVNPDGYYYTHTADRMWRKNRARFGSTIVGVDLNRNFGFSWGHSGPDIASTGDPTHNNYRGAESFSEPESCAIKDLILYSGTPFKIFLTYHAYSEVISFPWCYSSSPCPDYVNLLEGGAIMAKAMYDKTGRMYKVGNFRDIMYCAAGTSIDWSYGTARIPFSYLVELRSKEHRFMLPKQEIVECCREALSGVLALADFVETRKCLNCMIYDTKIP